MDGRTWRNVSNLNYIALKIIIMRVNRPIVIVTIRYVNNK